LSEIVVVGAGYGGLAASALLAKDGHKVTVIEKNEQVGGRAGMFKKDGFSFDMGPSWYMWPQVFERFFAEFGKDAKELLNLKRLDPSYRVYFNDGDVIEISSDIQKNYELFDTLEENGAEKLRQYLDACKRQYEIAMRSLVYRTYNSVFDFLSPSMIIDVLRLKGFSSFHGSVKKYFKNPFIVYNMQIKPTWDRVILKGIKNCFSVYLSFNSGITSREFISNYSVSKL
jgi:phytoene desaturase